MTRFLMNLDEAVDLVMFAFEHANPGDLFIQKSDASTIGDLAKAVQTLFGDTGTNMSMTIGAAARVVSRTVIWA